MHNYFFTLVYLVTLITGTHSFAAAQPERFTAKVNVTPSIADFDAADGWTERRSGKFLDSTKNVFGRIEADTTLRLSDTLSLETNLTTHTVSLGPSLGFTEAFFHWRPVPQGPTRHRIKLGVFYPPISLENSETGWQSPFTNNFSAINTWIAEEIRTAGLEVTHLHKFLIQGHRLKTSISYAPFVGNDPAGSLLAWKGWSLHDRQSNFRDRLPLVDLPIFESGALLADQSNNVQPFKEIDDRLGFYVGADFSLDNRILVRTLHYDNRADPEQLDDGQYGWRTSFSSIGISTDIASTKVILQAVKGSTKMGPRTNQRRIVDNQFSSAFLLLSKDHKDWRFTFRQDWFEVEDRDFTLLDPNGDKGYATTLTALKRQNSKLTFFGEWTFIKSERPAWELLGYDEVEREYSLSVGFTYSFEKSL